MLLLFLYLCIVTYREIFSDCWGLTEVIPDHVHSSEKLFAASITNRQGVLDFGFTLTFSPRANTAIKNIMVYVLVNHSLWRVTFEYNGIANDIFRAFSHWFAQGLFRPPEARVFGSLLTTSCVSGIHQTHSKFKTSLHVVVLIGTVGFPFFCSPWL